MSESGSDGVVLTADDEDADDDESEPAATWSWAAVWDQVGLDVGDELSTTQADLAADAYPVARRPAAAVEAGTLRKVYTRGVAMDGESVRIHCGYRLDEPVEGDHHD
jgi:hypothetical protein